MAMLSVGPRAAKLLIAPSKIFDVGELAHEYCEDVTVGAQAESKAENDSRNQCGLLALLVPVRVCLVRVERRRTCDPRSSVMEWIITEHDFSRARRNML
jgi:hypothetical protein